MNSNYNFSIKNNFGDEYQDTIIKYKDEEYQGEIKTGKTEKIKIASGKKLILWLENEKGNPPKGIRFINDYVSPCGSGHDFIALVKRFHDPNSSLPKWEIYYDIKVHPGTLSEGGPQTTANVTVCEGELPVNQKGKEE